MKKEMYITNYQHALYLKGYIKDIEEWQQFLDIGLKKQAEKLDRNDFEGWSRIQLLDFLLHGSFVVDLNGYGWWYNVTNDEGEEVYDSDKDPDYMPDPCDNYSEVSTKVFTNLLERNCGKGKKFVLICHPEEIKEIKKGGRWRTIGKLVAQRKRQGHFY
jgi:hypothetical protein